MDTQENDRIGEDSETSIILESVRDADDKAEDIESDNISQSIGDDLPPTPAASSTDPVGSRSGGRNAEIAGSSCQKRPRSPETLPSLKRFKSDIFTQKPGNACDESSTEESNDSEIMEGDCSETSVIYESVRDTDEETEHLEDDNISQSSKDDLSPAPGVTSADPVGSGSGGRNAEIAGSSCQKQPCSPETLPSLKRFKSDIFTQKPGNACDESSTEESIDSEIMEGDCSETSVIYESVRDTDEETEHLDDDNISQSSKDDLSPAPGVTSADPVGSGSGGRNAEIAGSSCQKRPCSPETLPSLKRFKSDIFTQKPGNACDESSTEESIDSEIMEGDCSETSVIYESVRDTDEETEHLEDDNISQSSKDDLSPAPGVTSADPVGSGSGGRNAEIAGSSCQKLPCSPETLPSLKRFKSDIFTQKPGNACDESSTEKSIDSEIMEGDCSETSVIYESVRDTDEETEHLEDDNISQSSKDDLSPAPGVTSADPVGSGSGGRNAEIAGSSCQKRPRSLETLPSLKRFKSHISGADDSASRPAALGLQGTDSSADQRRSIEKNIPYSEPHNDITADGCDSPHTTSEVEVTDNRAPVTSDSRDGDTTKDDASRANDPEMTSGKRSPCTIS